MPGQYSIRCRSRPHPESSGTQTAPPRRFLCVRCRAPVLVCSHCDRGQIYCAGGCAKEARACAQRAAGQRYQESFRGRLKHAARSARHRARQKIVTHQGSPREPRDDVVRLDAATAANKPATASSCGSVMRSQVTDPGSWRCHWCGCRCSLLVRIGFLRRRWRSSSRGRKRGEHHDHPA
jgi:hypothetical protein